MVPRAGPELKSSQEFRKARWHHLRIGSNMSWSKAHLLVRAANKIRDHATCARISTLHECAQRAWKVWIPMIRSRFGCARLDSMDANAIAII